MDYYLNDRSSCPQGSDSGIENCSGNSGNSSVLLNTTTGNAMQSNSETTSVLDISEVQEDDMLLNDIEKDLSVEKRTSSDSGSTFEIVQSPDLSEAISPPMAKRLFSPPEHLELHMRNGSQSSSKMCEGDFVEERDTFSPLSVVDGIIDGAGVNGGGRGSVGEYSSDQPSDEIINTGAISTAISEALAAAAAVASASAMCNGSMEIDNKLFDKKRLRPTSSKEEKQRQNEEIVIMETSSISSETGSWESVFPHRINIDGELKNSCENFLVNERKNCGQHVVEQLKTPDDETPSQMNTNHQASTGTIAGVSACFIDASSLLDEDELAYSSLGPNLPENGCCGPAPSYYYDDDDDDEDEHYRHLESEKYRADTTKNSPVDEHSPVASLEKDEWTKKVHLNKLEEFHKSFEMCKTKKLNETVNKPNTNSSSCSSNSSQKSDENAQNLSDEEKLWNREIIKKQTTIQSPSSTTITNTPTTTSNGSNHGDIKDQYNKKSPGDFQRKLFSVDSSHAVDDSYGSLSRQEVFDNDAVKLRRDQERKQGTLVFQNNIQQFSGHLISPKIPFTNDISYAGTDYSSSSPAPSLAWSDVERTKINYDSSNFGDASDCGETSSVNFSTHEQPSSCIFPDTPHNSIIQIDPALRVSSGYQRDSGTYSDATDSSITGNKVPKRSKCDESAPIVSGGVSIKDFTPRQYESPPVKRKTDMCPIVSGGLSSFDFHINDEEERKKKLNNKPKTSRQSTASWVVDMSDCNESNRRRSTSSSSSTDNTARSMDLNLASHRSGSGSGSVSANTGFYVSLNDMEPPKSIDNEISASNRSKLSKSLHENMKKSTGFYVDFSESENSRNITSPPPSVNVQTPPINSASADKKNMFSMFIDFGDKKSSTKREPLSLASRLSSSLHQKRSDDIMKTSCSSTETLMSRSTTNQCHNDTEKLDSAGETVVASSDESHKPSLLLRDDDVELPTIPFPAFRRLNQQRNFAKDETKRHSWNPNMTTATSSAKAEHEHKRSTSLTGDKGLMSIIDKIPLISKTSSMSIDSSLSPFDEFSCSKSEMSTYSNNSTTSASGCENENTSNIPKLKIKKRRKDVQINETFDKSSIASLADEILAKDLSPGSTDTDDLTFQQEENVFADESTTVPNSAQTSKENGSRPLIMETIIETKETSSPKKLFTGNSLTKSSSAHTMETLHATIEKQKQLLETVNEHTETNAAESNFVKLSDMDKPMAKFELHSPETMMSKSVGNHRQINRLFHETRARPHSWAMTRSTGNHIMNITNSVENLRSLTRLFPHLSNEFSNSLPNDMSLDHCNRSPNEFDFITSDISAESSLASSFSRSGLDESSISCRQPRRLGEDLLKMFLQEVATDMVVEVNGRRIKAHKCILRSRCQYFAAMLAGGWVQSSGNIVSLTGYSYSSVHFALCHIYSGASHPPDGISLMELAALADLLGLEGLKEVTAHALKTNYCHNFHKPCSGCIEGILQVLPVALNHALDDLYRKCLKWTCRHYLKVWPTRNFSQVPNDILGRCRQQIVAHITSETVLDSILDCDHLISQLAPCRWGIVIENLVRDILDAAYGYVSDHFASLIASDSFLSLGHDKCSQIARLESILLRTASSLTPDQACRSYQRVTRLNTVLAAKVIKMPNIGDLAKELEMHEEEHEWNEEFIRLVGSIMSAVEQCLTRQCAKAMRVMSWQRMDLELRKKIQTLARLTEPNELRRGKTVSKAFTFNGSSSSRNQDLYQVKLAIQAHTKRALAQDAQLYRATTHTQTNAPEKAIQTNEKGIQANHEYKILKTNSKVHVPQSSQSTVTIKIKTANEKTNNLGHRRTQSEDSSISARTSTDISSNQKLTKPRLSEIRPRYLEPRRPRSMIVGGPLKSQTSSNIQTTFKGKHISSSDSSRNSSPATGRNAANNNTQRIGTKSVNMSLDSLASPSRKNKVQGKKMNDKAKANDNEISVDSLGESMKSSMKTNKTVSQESLSSSKFSRSNPIINKENVKHPTLSVTLSNKKTTSKFLTKTKSISCQNNASTGSSPSSVTNKSSSRISSISSVNSPRDAFKNRSISVPANGNNSAAGQPVSATSTVRKSFLSAKSREILARRAEKTKIANSSGDEKSQSSTMSANIPNRINIGHPINKSSSVSNIPTRRMMPPTTLHLRKTPKYSPTTTTTITVKSKHEMPIVGAKTITTASNKIPKNTKNIEKKSYGMASDNRKIDHHSTINGATNSLKYDKLLESPKDPRPIESKLERSSTFCKESSDLPVGELQVIE